MAQPAVVGAWRRGEGHATSDYAANVHAGVTGMRRLCSRSPPAGLGSGRLEASHLDLGAGNSSRRLSA
jgi:hypothetical protein